MEKSSLISVLYLLTLLTVASIPLDGLTVDIGTAFSLSDIFSLVAVPILFLHSTIGYRKARESIPSSFYFVCKILLLFFLICFLGNLTFLLDKPNLEAQSYFAQKFGFDGLSIFRTMLKPLQAFFESLISFSWVLIPILVIRTKFQVIQVAWVYVVSSSLQATLGIFQFVYFAMTGNNLFPIYRGGLIGENSYTQSASTIIQGIRFLRINALAGEPKGLAIVLCFGIAVTCFLVACQPSNKRKFFIICLLLIHLLALLLTFSTLGYANFIIGIAVYAFLVKDKWTAIFLTAIISPIFVFGANSLLASVFQARLERIGFEDMDLVYLYFIQNSPSYLLLGTGFGTFHLASFQQTSEIIKWDFGIILPKLGILEILAVSGCLGLLVLSTLFFILLSRFSLALNVQDPFKKAFYMNVRNLVVYMIIIGVIVRLTPLGLLWIGIGFAITSNCFLYLDKKQMAYSKYDF